MTMYREEPINDAHVISFSIAAVFVVSAAVLGIYGIIAWDLAWGSLGAGSMGGLFVFVWRIHEHDKRGWRIIEQLEQEREAPKQPQVVVKTPGRNWVHIANDRSVQYVWQPQPAMLANLIKQAVGEDSRVQFSQRQAVERGWTVAEYRVMVAQLQALDWLSEQVRNGAPVFNRARIDEIYEWLEQSPHPIN